MFTVLKGSTTSVINVNLKVNKSVVRLCLRMTFYNKDIKLNSFVESQTVLKED